MYSLVDLQSVHVVILDTTGTGPHKLNCYLIASCTYYLTAYVDGMQEYLYIQKDNCQHDLGGFFYVIYAHKFDVKFSSSQRQIDVSLTCTLRKIYAKFASLLRQGETCLRGPKSQNVSWDSQNTPFRQFPASSRCLSCADITIVLLW